MVHVIVQQEAKDYAQWKEVFEEYARVRKEAGSQGSRIFRNETDPNDITVLHEWDDITKARTFFQSNYLQRIFEKAGITCEPQIYYEVGREDM
jgi:quinol monooxygenase YgiN